MSVSTNTNAAQALREAITRVGGFRPLSRELGIDHAGIARWKRCPPTHALKVERLSGVSRYRLRPDVYGEAP